MHQQRDRCAAGSLDLVSRRPNDAAHHRLRVGVGLQLAAQLTHVPRNAGIDRGVAAIAGLAGCAVVRLIHSRDRRAQRGGEPLRGILASAAVHRESDTLPCRNDTITLASI